MLLLEHVCCLVISPLHLPRLLILSNAHLVSSLLPPPFHPQLSHQSHHPIRYQWPGSCMIVLHLKGLMRRGGVAIGPLMLFTLMGIHNSSPSLYSLLPILILPPPHPSTPSSPFLCSFRSLLPIHLLQSLFVCSSSDTTSSGGGGGPDHTPHLVGKGRGLQQTSTASDHAPSHDCIVDIQRSVVCGVV